MDKDLLIYYMKKANKSRDELAKDLGISPRSIDNKLSGVTDFGMAEVRTIIRVLKLSNEATFEIFFANNVA